MVNRTDVALEAARQGAAVAADLFETRLDVETKDSRLDYVTEADTTAQERVVERIGESYPDDAIVGEEAAQRKTVPEAGDYWVVDPIDGTTNYVLGLPVWATSVAAVVDGDPVAAVTITPALSHTYVADETTVRRDDDPVSVSDRDDVAAFTVAPILRYGQDRNEAFADLLRAVIVSCGDLRRFGCAQATFAMVASGTLDAAAAIQPTPNPWDTIAGVHMVRQAGGTVTDLAGDPWTPSAEGLVASNGNDHDALVVALDRSLDA